MSALRWAGRNRACCDGQLARPAQCATIRARRVAWGMEQSWNVAGGRSWKIRGVPL